MFFYVTYAEQPSGVYSGQVCDAIRFIKKKLNADVRLVAFISLRGFLSSRRRLRNDLPGCIVFPMLPKAQNWRFNISFLRLICFLYGVRGLVCRNVIAANMALRLKECGSIKIFCFDGRGAIAAEWHEYDVGVIPEWKARIDEWEYNAVMKSDFRIAISQQLIQYWRERYGYEGNSHVIIPCTINSKLTGWPDYSANTEVTRRRFGFDEKDLILVYSGSTAGWQSFELLESVITRFLKISQNNKVLFLSPPEVNIERMMQQFQSQVVRLWVDHEDVTPLLEACDIGLLLREKSITNRVASPTKFAEYLAAGLPVIISEELGDYSAFVKEHRCGIIVGTGSLSGIGRTSVETRQQMKKIADKFFVKDAYMEDYRKIVSAMQQEFAPIEVQKNDSSPAGI